MKNILYIHGLNCSSTIFNFIKCSLPEHNAICANYESTKSIEESLSYLEHYIPNENFSIVGHSLGGIMASLISLRKTNDVKLDKIVTISTPFGGSSVAGMLKWVYPHHAILKDISPRSKIINELHSSNIKTPMLSVISTSGHIPIIPMYNDGVVTIKSQETSQAKRKHYYNSNHFEIVQDIRTVNSIKSFIWS